MIRATFRIRLPESVWVADVSQAFPDATFTLLSGYRLDDRAVELGEVTGYRPAVAVDAMRDHPAIHDYELLESDDSRALGRYETTDTDLYDFVELSSLTIEFPVAVQNGWYTFELTGTRNELDALRDVLEDIPLPYELESLVTRTERESLLTERQREVLDAALELGYFEVPRECTLAELADAVGVDKSTASTVLRRGEATLVRWFLTGTQSLELRTR